eukprot:scaffold328495_cov29-Attheya_sp.AAC.2
MSMYILRGKVFNSKTRSTTPPSFCKTGKRRAILTNANSKTRSLNAMKTSAKNNFTVMTYHDARTQARTPFGDLRGHTASDPPLFLAKTLPLPNLSHDVSYTRTSVPYHQIYHITPLIVSSAQGFEILSVYHRTYRYTLSSYYIESLRGINHHLNLLVLA